MVRRNGRKVIDHCDFRTRGHQGCHQRAHLSSITEGGSIEKARCTRPRGTGVPFGLRLYLCGRRKPDLRSFRSCPPLRLSAKSRLSVVGITFVGLLPTELLRAYTRGRLGGAIRQGYSSWGQRVHSPIRTSGAHNRAHLDRDLRGSQCGRLCRGFRCPPGCTFSGAITP